MTISFKNSEWNWVGREVYRNVEFNFVISRLQLIECLISFIFRQWTPTSSELYFISVCRQKSVANKTISIFNWVFGGKVCIFSKLFPIFKIEQKM